MSHFPTQKAWGFLSDLLWMNLCSHTLNDLGWGWRGEGYPLLASEMLTFLEETQEN